jgi:hypothetical protein
MRLLHRVVVALREWFRFGQVDQEFGEELRFHLEREVQANLERGMTLSEAHRQACVTVGHVETISEASREARYGASARQFLQDISYGWRLLRKSPGFALASTSIVALGIAATTAISAWSMA